MDVILWLAWAAGLAVVLVVGLVPVRREALEKAAVRLARRSGLALVPAVRDRVDRRLLLRRRWVNLSGAVVLTVVSLLIALVSDGRWTNQSTWLLVGASFTSGSAGIAVTGFRLSRTARATGPRLARSRAVGLADYLPRAERVAARVLPLFGIGVTTIAVWTRAASSAVSLVGLLLLVAAVVLFEVGARRIVDAPQPAQSADELAWDDAFRSSDVRALALAPMGIGAYVGFASGWAIDSGTAGTTAAVWGVIAALVMMVFALRAESEGAGRHFLRQLWPDAARVADGGAPS